MTSLPDVLAQIRQRESGGNYGKRPEENYRYPASHASGAYQFQPATWRQYTAASGIGKEYSEAYLAPQATQDAVAAYAALHGPGINSPALWGASAPAGGYPAIAPGSSLDAVTGPLEAAAGASAIGGSGSGGGSDFLGIGAALAGLVDWVERGFLIVVGLVIVAFGLWHLMGRPTPSAASIAELAP